MQGKAAVTLVCLAVLLGVAAFATRAIEDQTHNSANQSEETFSDTDRTLVTARYEEASFPAQIPEAEIGEITESDGVAEAPESQELQSEFPEEAGDIPQGENAEGQEVLLEAPSASVVEESGPLSSAESGVSSSSLVGGSYAAVGNALTVDGVLGATNAERYQENLPLLASNSKLALAARIKLNDILDKQYFAHESPAGETVADLAQRADYAYIRLGENLAMGNFKSNSALVDAWMNSPGHRENILKEGYSEIGIAVGRGAMNGREVWVAVQEFGLPRSICPEIPSDIRATALDYKDELMLLMRIVEVRREELEKHEPGSSSHRAAAERYNLAARAYNDRLAIARPEFESYNALVRQFNECVKEKTEG